MDLIQLIARARRLLLQPRAEWSVIANESASVGGRHWNYLLFLAAIPALLQLLKRSTLSTDAASVLIPTFLGYALAFVTVYVTAWIVDALAPKFHGESNPTQSRRTVAYAYTASLVASIAIVAPGWWMLAVGAGALYAVYLLYLGLPLTMKCPPEKAAGYAAVTVVTGVLLGFVATSVVNQVASLIQGPTRGDSDLNANLGTSERDPETAAANEESATTALTSSEALEDVPAAARTEALTPERLQPFVPVSLLGRERTSVSAERSRAMGGQVTRAAASFMDEDGRPLELEIIDLGGPRSRQLPSSALASDPIGSDDPDGEEVITETWDETTSTGEYTVVIANRFTVKITGEAENIDALKAVTAELDLATLEDFVRQ